MSAILGQRGPIAAELYLCGIRTDVLRFAQLAIAHEQTGDLRDALVVTVFHVVFRVLQLVHWHGGLLEFETERSLLQLVDGGLVGRQIAHLHILLLAWWVRLSLLSWPEHGGWYVRYRRVTGGGLGVRRVRVVGVVSRHGGYSRWLQLRCLRSHPRGEGAHCAPYAESWRHRDVLATFVGSEAESIRQIVNVAKSELARAMGIGASPKFAGT